jgi:hypothetical protein
LEENPAFEYFAKLLAGRILIRRVLPDALEAGNAAKVSAIFDLPDLRMLHRFVEIFGKHGNSP